MSNETKNSASNAIESSTLLDDLVIDYGKSGCPRMDKSLGFQKMPDGYALMLNCDHTHYFWLRFDGTQSVIDWNKWNVRRGAFAHSSNV
jgi:hypothetical protein